MDCDVIKVLPESVANQIAAGEVIQQPASVVKELIENSVDAGATLIKLSVKDGGRTLVQVTDNGKGMSPGDARLAFHKHATSKIQLADDLTSLHTMGFRGEALASIVAVAQVEMRTRRRDDELGTCVRFAEGKFKSLEPVPANPGTDIMVKNLFYHLPARRKYLKKDSVEFTRIVQEFEKLALVNPDVEFMLYNNDVLVHQLMRGTLKQRITALYGKAIDGQIIPVGTETPVVKISGFVGLPQHARRRKPPQFFFVNGRNMEHPYFRKAVLNCYAELISPDVQPIYFLDFQVDPSTIDVNIHPQKHEIKFEHEQTIWQILSAAVRQALGKVNAAGAIDFDADQSPDIPVFIPDRTQSMPDIATDETYNPFDDISLSAPRSKNPADTPAASMPSRLTGRSAVPRDWDKLYANFEAKLDAPSSVAPASAAGPAQSALSVPAPEPAPAQPALIDDGADSPHTFLTLHNKYVVVSARNGLLVIDRRRAHIRVLFEKFLEQLRAGTINSQKLIFPEMVTLTPAQNSILSTVEPMLSRLGFDISFLGDGTWSIISVPAIQSRISPVETLTRIIADIDENGQAPDDAIIEPAALNLARAAAIAPGMQLTEPETESIIDRLFRSPQPDYTPDGLKIIATIPNDQLTKLFI